MRPIIIVALLLSLLPAGPVRATDNALRLVVDPSTNHFDALEIFLDHEGYWPDEKAAVLDPLQGQLSLGHDTAAVRLVRSLDDIPGLRPLPDGTLDFLHGHHNTFYLEVGQDRLLLGVSHLFDGPRVGKVAGYHLEKFDLVTGVYRDLGSTLEGNERLTGFLLAHGAFLGRYLMFQPLWFLFLLFLAIRLRRHGRADGDALVRKARIRTENRLFLAAAAAWCLHSSALLGLAQFSQIVGFMDTLTSGSPSYGLLRDRALLPEQYRLLSWILALVLALGSTIILGLWAGVFNKQAAGEHRWPDMPAASGPEGRP